MCGFETSASFAKSFKNHFKMTATKWRSKACARFDRASTPIQVERGTVTVIKGSPVWTFQNADAIRQVVVESISEMTVAYVRNVGPYEGNEDLFSDLYTQLFTWAVPRGLVDDTCVPLNIYHDNPDITEKQKLRVMVAIPVDASVKPEGAIGVTRLSGGKYGVCRFLLKKDEFGEAWDWMFSSWLANSGYERDDREAFERCYKEKIIGDVRFFEVDICIPVRPK